MIVSTAPYWERPAFEPASMKEIVVWAAGAIKERGIEAVAASGNSGLAIAGAIAYEAGIPVFAVRKPGDPHKNTTGVAPAGPVARWAFVDDLIESGRTLDRVRDGVARAGLATSDVPSLILLYYPMYPMTSYRVGETDVPVLTHGA